MSQLTKPQAGDRDRPFKSTQEGKARKKGKKVPKKRPR
jgi:hypothetical protein